MQKALHHPEIHTLANIIASTYADPANNTEAVIKAKYPNIDLHDFPALYAAFYQNSLAIITKYNDEQNYASLYEYLEGSGHRVISDPAYWTIAQLICYISNYCN